MRATRVAGWLGIGQDNVIRVRVAARQFGRCGGAGSGGPRAACGGQTDRGDRGDDGHDRRVWHRRPGGHSCDARATGRGVQAAVSAASARRRGDRLGVVGVSATIRLPKIRSAFAGGRVRALAAAVSRIRHLKLADSLGIDFHKTGFAPYVSSLFLLRDRADFGTVVRERETMPYLYHTGEYHPGMFTLETTRSATGVMAALANLLLLGKEGFRTLDRPCRRNGRSAARADHRRPELSVLNDQNYGPVTLFRAYPPGVDTFRVIERERTDPSYVD